MTSSSDVYDRMIQTYRLEQPSSPLREEFSHLHDRSDEYEPEPAADWSTFAENAGFNIQPEGCPQCFEIYGCSHMPPTIPFWIFEVYLGDLIEEGCFETRQDTLVASTSRTAYDGGEKLEPRKLFTIISSSGSGNSDSESSDSEDVDSDRPASGSPDSDYVDSEVDSGQEADDEDNGVVLDSHVLVAAHTPGRSSPTSSLLRSHYPADRASTPDSPLTTPPSSPRAAALELPTPEHATTQLPSSTFSFTRPSGLAATATATTSTSSEPVLKPKTPKGRARVSTKGLENSEPSTSMVKTPTTIINTGTSSRPKILDPATNTISTRPQPQLQQRRRPFAASTKTGKGKKILKRQKLAHAVDHSSDSGSQSSFSDSDDDDDNYNSEDEDYENKKHPVGRRHPKPQPKNKGKARRQRRPPPKSPDNLSPKLYKSKWVYVGPKIVDTRGEDKWRVIPGTNPPQGRCNDCPKIIGKCSDLVRHVQAHGPKDKICMKCNKGFCRLDPLKRHCWNTKGCWEGHLAHLNLSSDGYWPDINGHASWLDRQIKKLRKSIPQAN